MARGQARVARRVAPTSLKGALREGERTRCAGHGAAAQACAEGDPEPPDGVGTPIRVHSNARLDRIDADQP